MKVVLATANVHKVREMRQLLKSLNPLIEFYSLRDFPHYASPEETGETFEANAILKAEAAAKALNMWALADDSGLVVPALQGAPGVFSARYAKVGATDQENRKKLLQQMERLEGVARSAYYECVLALAAPEGLKKTFRGTCEGHIIRQEKGGNGFGYDPLFIKNDYGITFAEMEESLKNQISHRAKAVAKLIVYLSSGKREL